MDHITKELRKVRQGALTVLHYLQTPEKKRTFAQSLQAINAYWIEGGSVCPLKTLEFVPRHHLNDKLYWAILKQTPDVWGKIPKRWKDDLIAVEVAEGNTDILETDDRKKFHRALANICDRESHFPSAKERDKRLDLVRPGLAAQYNELRRTFPDLPSGELVSAALSGSRMTVSTDVELPVF